MRVYGLSEADIKMQYIVNLQGSLLIHILNRSPLKKREELRKKIKTEMAELKKLY